MPALANVFCVAPAFKCEGGVAEFVLFRSNGYPELKANP